MFSKDKKEFDRLMYENDIFKVKIKQLSEDINKISAMYDKQTIKVETLTATLNRRNAEIRKLNKIINKLIESE